MKLVYTGTVKELGFKLPLSTKNERVVVRPGEPFEVDAANGAALLQTYSAVLQEAQPTKRASKPPKPAEKPEESDGKSD